MLSRHQPDPRSETAARREDLPISYFGHQRGGDDRANTRDFLQPPAFFTRAVPGMDTLLDGYGLFPDSRILASKDVETEPGGRWNAIILLISDDLEQLCRAIAALCGDDAELGPCVHGSHSTALFADKPEAAGCDATSSRTAAVQTSSPQIASTAA